MPGQPKITIACYFFMSGFDIFFCKPFFLTAYRQLAAYRSSSPVVALWLGRPASTLAAASAAEFFTGEYAAHTCTLGTFQSIIGTAHTYLDFRSAPASTRPTPARHEEVDDQISQRFSGGVCAHKQAGGSAASANTASTTASQHQCKGTWWSAEVSHGVMHAHAAQSSLCAPG